LIGPRAQSIVPAGGKGEHIVSRTGLWAAGLAAVLSAAAGGLAGCASAPAGAGSAGPAAGPACRCPPPVHYSDAEIKAISAVLRALPQDNPLQQAMSDYENERDNLRICLGR
jgi:type IV pilus biogenesis protein CpaD/CtpE